MLSRSMLSCSMLCCSALCCGALTLAGCGDTQGWQVTRTVGGRVRTGPFVSPYAYEHFVRAELANIQGNLRAAELEYRRARTGPTDDPLLIARLADVVDRLGREAEALALLDQGEALDPSAEAVWMARGRIAERHGHSDLAIEAYARAAAVAPGSEQGAL
ncbi:MAG: tetratricopeptide repeat protein, partial [Sandaracinaceae bacterium]|nr:tetratricopeptide repeat protein [Sandaracinaceae bacterium]